MSRHVETLRQHGPRRFIHWNGEKWGVLVDGDWLFVATLGAGLGREQCRKWISSQVNR